MPRKSTDTRNLYIVPIYTEEGKPATCAAYYVRAHTPDEARETAKTAYTDTTAKPCRTAHVALYAARASGEFPEDLFPLAFH